MDFRAKSALSLIPSSGFKHDAELDALYRRYSDGIRRYVARTFGGGPPEPEDVVQIAFEKYAALSNSEKIDNPGAFLMRSARNYVIDQRRRLSVRAAYVREEQVLGDMTDDFDPARVIEARERWTAVEAAIVGLDKRLQEVLIMNRIHGLSCAEIARRRRCSATQVKTLLARALVECQRALRETDKS